VELALGRGQPGAWNDLFVEATDDNGVVHRVEFDVEVGLPLALAAPDGVCTRSTAPVSMVPKTLSGVMGNATLKFNTTVNGMTFDPSTGALTGTPDVMSRGDLSWGVTDDWDNSTYWTRGIGLERRDPLAITWPAIITRNAGDGDNMRPSANGLPWWAPASFTLANPENLPPGMKWSGSDGYLVGTYAQPGTYDLDIRLDSDCPTGASASGTYRFVVNSHVYATAASSVTMREGVASRTTPAPTANFAQPPVYWDREWYWCCNVPEGTQIDRGTGQVYGTPAKGTAGTYTIRARANDATGAARSTSTSWSCPDPGSPTTRPCRGAWA